MIKGNQIILAKNVGNLLERKEESFDDGRRGFSVHSRFSYSLPLILSIFYTCYKKLCNVKETLGICISISCLVCEGL